jgi:hypothetical protein
MAKTIGEDFTEDIKVNRFKLEEENEIQPALYDHYSREYAEAKRLKDEEDDRLRFIVAKTSLRIRSSAEGKTTEAMLSSLVETDDGVQEQKEALRKANARLYTLQGAMDALDSRKYALGNLTTLYSKNYYQGKVMGGSDEGSEAMNDELNRRRDR